MTAPQSPRPTGGTNFLTYTLVGVTGLGILGFAYLLFGQQMLVAVTVCAMVGGIGCAHYWLWGRSLTAELQREQLERTDGASRTD